MDLGTVVAIVALIAAAASLTWQRKSTDDQRKARLEDEKEKLAQSGREVANLVTQKLALVTARATKYARLESQINRLLLANLSRQDRDALTAHLNRVVTRANAYNKQSEEASQTLSELRRTADMTSKEKYDELASAFTKENIYLENTGDEESRGIEADIARIEAAVSKALQ